MVMTITRKWYFAINSTARKGAPLPMKKLLSIINIVLPLSNKHIISTYYDDVSQSSCELFLSFFNENIIIICFFKKKKIACNKK
jgi:hypothetical protein